MKLCHKKRQLRFVKEKAALTRRLTSLNKDLAIKNLTIALMELLLRRLQSS